MTNKKPFWDGKEKPYEEMKKNYSGNLQKQNLENDWVEVILKWRTVVESTKLIDKKCKGSKMENSKKIVASMTHKNIIIGSAEWNVGRKGKGGSITNARAMNKKYQENLVKNFGWKKRWNQEELH